MILLRREIHMKTNSYLCLLLALLLTLIVAMAAHADESI